MTSRRRSDPVAGRAGVGLLVALLAVGGCSSRRNGEPGQDIATATEASIVSRVERLATQIATVAGAKKLKDPATNAAPCENNVGDTSESVQYVLGTYSIDLPRDKHRVAFTAVRDRWRNLGWQITDDRFREDL